jgi:hypothetical protein
MNNRVSKPKLRVGSQLTRPCNSAPGTTLENRMVRRFGDSRRIASPGDSSKPGTISRQRVAGSSRSQAGSPGESVTKNDPRNRVLGASRNGRCGQAWRESLLA